MIEKHTDQYHETGRSVGVCRLEKDAVIPSRCAHQRSVPDLVRRFVEYGRKARCTLREIVYFLFSEVIFSENKYTVPSCLSV